MLSTRTVPAREKDPLRLSGVALAGANHRGVAGPGEEDGIVTAEEISEAVAAFTAAVEKTA